MKVYAIDDRGKRVAHGWEPALVEAEVVKETTAFLHFAQREPGFHYSKRVKRSEACLTPMAAWQRYSAQERERSDSHARLKSQADGNMAFAAIKIRHCAGAMDA